MMPDVIADIWCNCTQTIHAVVHAMQVCNRLFYDFLWEKEQTFFKGEEASFSIAAFSVFFVMYEVHLYLYIARGKAGGCFCPLICEYEYHWLGSKTIYILLVLGS